MVISETLIKEQYTKEDKTISMLKANILAIVIMAPIAIILFFFYTMIRGFPDLLEYGLQGYFNELLMIIIGFLILSVLHELVHGFVWHLYCDKKWKSIQFGIVLKLLTPYCHCKELLNVQQYRLGTIAPLLVTGILPYIISLIFGNFILMAISIFMVIGAGGDVTILLLLMKEKSSAIICDHPSLCGCVLYRENL